VRAIRADVERKREEARRVSLDPDEVRNLLRLLDERAGDAKP
jgi:hypothetical protein